MAKLLFFTSHNLWTSHFETELEIIEQALAEGHEVHQLGCFAELSRCDHNMEGDLESCLRCLKRRKAGADLLSSQPIRHSLTDFLHNEDHKEIANQTFQFESVEDVKAISYHGANIGIGVISSLISLLRTTSFDVAQHRELVQSYLKDTLTVYLSVKRAVEKINPDKVYFFNGRFAHVRAAMHVCQHMNVDFGIHERGHDIHHYEVYRNHLPHSIENFTRNALELWEQSNSQEREATGKLFYEKRREGASVQWYSFVKDQAQDLLPENWSSDQQNIVIFNSSEDEMAAIGEEWKNHLYPSQLEAVKRICRDFEGETDYHFYLRMHPNLANAQPSEYLPFYELDQLANLTVIKPESKISTYKLIDTASKIISFGSTVGIEACFWGKPSILAGKTFYKDLEGTYNPQSHEEVIKLIREHLGPRPIEGALIYGHYFSSFGKAFQWVSAFNFDKVHFKGNDLTKVKVNKIPRLLAKYGAPLIRNLNGNFKLLKNLYT